MRQIVMQRQPHRRLLAATLLLALISVLTSCIPQLVKRPVNESIPPVYQRVHDTLETSILTDTTQTTVLNDSASSALKTWKQFFRDSTLITLIDSAVRNNQELNMLRQEIELAQQEIVAREGAILPEVEVSAGAGADKAAAHTRDGAVEENLPIAEGRAFPTPLTDLGVGLGASWQVDIWGKLHNARDAARLRYLASIEGTKYLITNLVSEVAITYYELLALDNTLAAVNANIDIQKRALHVIQQQKAAAKATELAVKRFEAEVFKNESRRYELQQKVTETENHLNFLVGRFPQYVSRSAGSFLSERLDSVFTGTPQQLITNRPDIQQASYALQAADLEINVAEAEFYPELHITGLIGMRGFDPQHFIATPESILYGLAADLAAPIINRKKLEAEYFSANAHRSQAAIDYERTVLRAYTEVSNQIAKINNMQRGFDLKQQQTNALTNSVTIAGNLFTSARADYVEVLLTQRDALEARMELIETKVQQMKAYVGLYQALGGGWY